MPQSGLTHAVDRWAALRAGARPDRPPVSFWRHFYDQENDLQQFVEAMVGFQKRFDWDLVKINPKASYHVEPWGVTVQYAGGPNQKPLKTLWPVQQADDLRRIHPLPTTHPQFDFQLRAVAAIRKALPRPLPMVITMFTPLSVLGDLVPDEQVLLTLIRENSKAVAAALENLTLTFAALAVEFLNAGADGLFFATTEWASRNLLGAEEHRLFGRPYDLQVLGAIAAGASFTVLHVCGAPVVLEEFADYPCTVVNWDAVHPANPTLHRGWDVLGRPVMGGIDGKADLLGLPPPALADKVRRLVSEHDDLPFAVGPGCAVPVQVSLESLQTVKDAVHTAARRR